MQRVLIALAAVLGLSITLTFSASAGPVSVGCSTQEIVDALRSVGMSEGPVSIDLADSCTYTLTTPDNWMLDEPNGLPVITSQVAVNGHGATILTSPNSDTQPFRVFEIAETGSLQLKDLTISGGTATRGGGILNEGTLDLDNTTFSGNTAVESGGAIENDNGFVSILKSTFTGNRAIMGGAVYSVGGSLTLSDSQFCNNSPAGADGAISMPGQTMQAFLNTTFDLDSCSIAKPAGAPAGAPAPQVRYGPVTLKEPKPAQVQNDIAGNFTFEWNAMALMPGDHYEVRVKNAGGDAWEFTCSGDAKCTATLRNYGDYVWSVFVVDGSGQIASSAGEQRLFKWRPKDAPAPSKDPPAKPRCTTG